MPPSQAPGTASDPRFGWTPPPAIGQGWRSASPASGGWVRPDSPAWLSRLFKSPAAIAQTYAGTSPPSYFFVALLCVLLCPLTGVVAVINSILVSYRYPRGDAVGAARASYLARMWCILTPPAFVIVAILAAVVGVNG